VGLVNPQDKVFSDFDTTICQILFVIWVMLICLKVNFGNKITVIIGIASYEIYLFHQIGIDIAKRMFNQYSYALTIILSIVFAVVIGLILHRLNSKVRRIFD
jgi:peptidoglycan/LPS O-acetylase OafA/YrhL